MNTKSKTQLVKLAIGLTSAVAVAGTIGQLYQVTQAQDGQPAIPAPTAGQGTALATGRGSASGGGGQLGGTGNGSRPNQGVQTQRRRENRGDDGEEDDAYEHQFGSGFNQGTPGFQFAPAQPGVRSGTRTRTRRS